MVFTYPRKNRHSIFIFILFSFFFFSSHPKISFIFQSLIVLLELLLGSQGPTGGWGWGDSSSCPARATHSYEPPFPIKLSPLLSSPSSISPLLLKRLTDIEPHAPLSWRLIPQGVRAQQVPTDHRECCLNYSD